MYDKISLKNGLTLIAERMPSFRSAAIGVWVKAGSIDENAADNGYSHFIEHMLFKGTETRSAQDIAQEMDAIGGQVNAFTSKECTCFHAKVIDEHLERAIALLSDLVLHSKFAPEDIEREKGVILEEISMVEDSPEDVAHDLLAQANFMDNPLSQTILGPAENIKNATRESLLAYKNALYTPQNAVISIAGSFDLDKVCSLIERYFGFWKGTQPPARKDGEPCEKLHLFKKKSIEQAHLCLGFDCAPQGTDEVYACTIFNTILGGGMSSRLFQSIREERGLAYSVYSFPSAYKGIGMMTLYAGTSPKNVQEVANSVAQELLKIKEQGFTQEEFEKARDQLICGYVLGQESTNARMNALGRSALLTEKILMPDDVIAKIKRTTLDDVNAQARYCITSPMSAALIGKNNSVDYSIFEKLRA